MNIYFSCSLTGGRGDQPVYAAIVKWLLAQEHEVSTVHLTQPNVMFDEDTLTPEAVFARDIAWLEAAEVVIAEVSTPSHGVGYEIAHAVLKGKRVLCLARQGVNVSKMVIGNPGLTFARYEARQKRLK
jgi:2'-deoxynucleoside 5'-phosphate N-hydrolase